MVPILATTELLDPTAVDLLTTALGVVLIPVWAVWLGRSVGGDTLSAA